MSNSILRIDREEEDDHDHDNDDDNDDDGDYISDQQQLELHKEDEEIIENIDKDDGSDEKDETVNFMVTADDDFLKKQQQLGDGISSTKDDDEDNDDGFRTPTSAEHKIPVPTHCPPAPKKNLKRKFEGSSITEIIRSATKTIHNQFMVLNKARQDDDALS